MIRNTEDRATCLGKLAVAGDFVRGASSGRAYGSLDAWVRAGVERATVAGGADWKARFDRAAPSRFVWSDPDGTLAGAWWASRDAAGRRYPFVILATLPPLEAADLASVPVALEPFFTEAERAWSEGWNGWNAAECAGRVATIPYRFDLLAARRECAERLEATPCSELRGAGADTPGDAANVLADIVDVVAGDEPAFCVRWAIEHRAVSISFWVEAMRRVGVPGPRLVMWSAEGSGKVRAAWGRPEAATFVGMAMPDEDDDAVYECGLRAVEGRDRFGRALERGSYAAALAALEGGVG